MLIGAPQHGNDTQINIFVKKPSILGERNLGSCRSLHHLCHFKFTPSLFFSIKQPKKDL
jgi:hypothetical protein